MAKTQPRSDDTRDHILETAMTLFRERGFEKTTMREVAAAANLALGAAYYYFESKDAIVLAFYERAQQQMDPQIEEALATGRKLRDRLAALIQVKLNVFGPDRTLLAALSGHTDPANPLSPFSQNTREIRERDVAFFARALDGSRTKTPKDLAPFLPSLLWFFQMGIILFWIYDSSPDQSKTAFLLRQGTALVAALIDMANSPLARPVRKQAAELLGGVFERR